MKNRWYDTNDKSMAVLDALRGLDELSRQKISENVISIASSIKAIKREKDEVPVSLGIERVVGLYQQSNRRRWYDKHGEISGVMQTMSTLSEDEYHGIMEALSMALSE